MVEAKPEYVAARVALAGEYAKAKQYDMAVAQLRAAVQLDAQNASLWEQIGDGELARKDSAAAKEAYGKAMQLQLEKSDKNRLRKKLAF